MTIANIIIAALKKRLAAAFAALALLAAASNATFAMTAQDRAGCVAPDCDVVAAVEVTDDQKGGLALADEKGRLWRLASFEGRKPVDMNAAIDWADGFAVIAAHDRYLDALSRNGAIAEKVSTDGRYHLCISGRAVTCIYVPAG